MLRLPRSLGPTVSRSSQICLRNGIGASGSSTPTACGPWFAVLNFLECRKKMQCKVHLTDQHFYFAFLSTSWPSHVPVCLFFNFQLFVSSRNLYLLRYQLLWTEMEALLIGMFGLQLGEPVCGDWWFGSFGKWGLAGGGRLLGPGPWGCIAPIFSLTFPHPKEWLTIVTHPASMMYKHFRHQRAKTMPSSSKWFLPGLLSKPCKSN